jgi:hypothetical protein
MELAPIAKWLLVGAALSPIWGAFLWELWEGSIRPRLIPRAEINAMSASMLSRFGDRAEEMAFIEEDRAWRYSESFEQGKWRRVRKRIHRMRGDAHPSVKARRASSV